jgi:hypothetical protein
MKILKVIWAVRKLTLMMWAFFFLLTVCTGDVKRIGWLTMAGISFAYTFFFVIAAIIYFLSLKPRTDAKEDTKEES